MYGGKFPFLVSGPVGIYISALCNNLKEDNIRLRLHDLEPTFHFLGYQLPEGKTLVLEGDMGDFIGAGLSGGKLVIEGSTGNWTGVGMMKGELVINGYVGQNTGEWMRGGEIYVNGQIQGFGKRIFNGRIYQRKKLVYPREITLE